MSHPHSGEGMASDSHGHNEGTFNPQFLDDRRFSPSQGFLQAFSQPEEYNNAPRDFLSQQQSTQDAFRSSSPQPFGVPGQFGPQGDFDFQLFGNQDPPQQNINPALFDQSNPLNQGIDPSTLMQGHHQGHHSPQIVHSQSGLGLATLTQDYNWEGVLGNPSFQTHRPAPSDRSEASSNAASPLFSHQDFPEQNSPLIGSMGEILHNDSAFGFDTFTLSDSRHHSPAHSPRMQPMPGATSGSNSPFLLAQDHHIHYGYNPNPQPVPMGPPPLPSDTINALRDRANANRERMQSFHQAPHIEIEFAPPQRQPTFPGKPGFTQDEDALSPPPKSPRRPRSHSDPYTTGQQQVAGKPPPRHERRNSLSPSDAPCSPGSTASNASSKMSRRVSAPPVPELERDKMLGLAKGPSGGAGSESKRVQKHPATFQCHLCPKRFTRAYNLRSHLRTHTDERPFVCTICGKAFARQHDRKRHEGLHSGEKKFVCRGQLKAGGTWGCGRRFARADALGRHFRSEAGRICIRPLLDEEHAEKTRAAAEQQVHQVPMGMHPMPILGTPMGGGMLVGGPGGMVLPTALLEQYPALATMDWNTVDPAGSGISGAENSGRSSFDASGEDWDDEEEEFGGASGASAAGSHRSSFEGGEREWVSDSGGHWR